MLYVNYILILKIKIFKKEMHTFCEEGSWRSPEEDGGVLY